MPTASEMRGIHSAHEAGMHDRKPKPDVCKMCASEAKKEQEAIQVAKQQTTCAACGGSYDGTPSGMVKHNKTAKHLAGLATLEADATVAQAAVTAADVESDSKAELGSSSKDPLIADLDALIAETSREKDRRTVDHKWRVANRPAEADGYFADKVLPLVQRQRLLEEVKRRLSS